MAMSAFQNADNSTIDSLKTGIEMVYTQLKRTLEEVGLIEIDAAGQKFDPSQHEAVSRKKTDEADEGTVMEQTPERLPTEGSPPAGCLRCRGSPLRGDRGSQREISMAKRDYYQVLGDQQECLR